MSDPIDVRFADGKRFLICVGRYGLSVATNPDDTSVDGSGVQVTYFEWPDALKVLLNVPAEPAEPAVRHVSRIRLYTGTTVYIQAGEHGFTLRVSPNGEGVSMTYGEWHRVRNALEVLDGMRPECLSGLDANR